MTEAGFTITHEQVSRDHSIKTLGLHPIQIRLHPEVSATIAANVARSEAEAETPAGTGRVVSEDEQRAVEEAAQVETDAALAEIEAEDADTETKSEAPAEGGAASEEAAKDAWERTLTLFRRVLV